MAAAVIQCSNLPGIMTTEQKKSKTKRNICNKTGMTGYSHGSQNLSGWRQLTNKYKTCIAVGLCRRNQREPIVHLLDLQTGKSLNVDMNWKQ